MKKNDTKSGRAPARRKQAFRIVALVALIAGSLTLFSPPVEAMLTTLSASPTYNTQFHHTCDVYYGDVGGVMFTVNEPADQRIEVFSLGRFFFGAGSYPESYNSSGGDYNPTLPYRPVSDNTGIRTLTLAKVTNPGSFTGTTLSGMAATVVATTTLNPATAPIAAGTQVSISIASGGAIGGWQYADLTAPVLLEQGATYIVTATQYGYVVPSPGGQVYARPDGTYVPLASGVTWIAAASGWDGSTFTALGYNYGLTAQVGPVNMLFDVIPEPSSMALLGLGAVLLMRRRSNGSETLA